MNHPITIVGGGLAGLALGIGLRQRDVPVTIWEAGSYPRHKVCGEFISGAGLQSLERLALREPIMAAGGRWARDAAFFVNGYSPIRQTLPQPALCVSRYMLDDLFAKEFRRIGGSLRERSRWSGELGDPGVVRATGRRAAAVVEGWRWFGLKAHARNVVLAADLELHLFADGYVGLCRLADSVNVCGLFRTQEPQHDLRRRWKELLVGPVGSKLRDGLANAEWDEESFCAVAGLNVEPRRILPEGECAVGDALTMVPPATGNGMSIALESAELAAAPLCRYSRGDSEWSDTLREIAEVSHRHFESRLKFAARLHRWMFQPLTRRLLALSATWFPSSCRLMFAHTR